jgi:NADP-dependent 3-hydroxy acid dehydrogenase YdfG
MMDIKHKVVAITGARRGIGAATATLLADRGAKLVLADHLTDGLAALASQLEDRGAEIVTAQVDVRRREQVAQLVETATSHFGRLDVLVANAGVGPLSPIAEARVDDWQQMVDVNLMGVLHGIAAAMPVFRRQGAGHFVNVASTAGLRVVADQAVYAATKSAVRTLSEGLRVESNGRWRVTIISPGFVRTSFAESAADAEVRARLIAARDRFAIPPEAIARAIAFAIEQPEDVDVSEIVVRPTAQN